MNKKRGKMQKNILFLAITMFLVILNTQSASSGCCTPPSPTTCFPSTSSSDCPNYFSAEDCTALLICQYNPGCCTDTCSDVSYTAQCSDRGKFKQGACSTQTECQQGCCVCSAEGTRNVCFKDITATQCSQECSSLVGYSQIMYDTSIHGDECLNNCQTYGGSKSNITGKVKTITNQPIQGATITAAGKTVTSASDGSYILTSIPSGSILVRASKQGYTTNTTLITVPTQPTTITHNPILPPSEQGQISGKITSSNIALKEALVTLTGQTFATELTDTNGNYQFDYIPFDTYTITASKQGYNPKSKTITISSTSPSSINNNLDLEKQPTGTILGSTVNKENEALVPFTKIYVNDILQTYSDNFGSYSLEIPATAEGINYNIYSIKNGYYKSDILSINIKTNQRLINQKLKMLPVSSECSSIAQPVTLFLANHIPGKKSVQLQWSPLNCNNIEGYMIYKEDQQLTYITPATITYHIDSDVQWGTKYRYKIAVIYNDAANKKSANKTAEITLGDLKCENKYLEQFQRFSEFCDGTYLRKTCNESNQVISAQLTTATTSNCESIGTDYYCSGPDYKGYTYCKSILECDPRKQEALPFGLYYNKDKCYGSLNPDGTYTNYCYYDYSTTVPDKCYACSQELTCFDYQSQDACTKDSCLTAAPNSSCEWYPNPLYYQLGKGNCYQTNYNDTDQCYRCSSQAGLFFNVQCTQDLCTKLGNCYADAQNTKCEKCEGQEKCEDFTTQEQCAGSNNQPIDIDNPACPTLITPSNSACGLTKCKWLSNKCVKDANDNNKADCSSQDTTYDTEACRSDVASPISKPPLGIINVNERTNIEFDIIDQNDGTLFYCFDLNGTCCPSASTSYQGSFASIKPFDSQELKTLYNSQGTYYICYYSKDQFANIEKIKCSRIWVDFTLPKIKIQHKVIENVTGKYPIVSNLQINITLDDEATCADSLKRDNTIIPNKIRAQKNQNFAVTYTNLDDGDYIYTVNCTDELGNIATNKTPILIDAYRLIIINSPKGAVKNPIIFNISTQDRSRGCELKNNNQLWRGELINQNENTWKNFWSNSYNDFLSKHYTNYTVECIDFNDPAKIDKAHFDFTVDEIFGPATSATIKSGNKETRSNITGWETWQQSSSTITLNCAPTLMGGFTCDKTYYCLTKSGTCAPNIQYSSPISVSNTTQIYYYSIDKGQNQEQTKHGTLTIGEGLGIKLKNPKYGATNKKIINLTIEMPVDTDICKFSFGDFKYADLLTPTNFFTKIDNIHFKINNFPKNPIGAQFQTDGETKTIYVKCRTKSGYINDDSPAIFTIEYDPSAPNLQQAYFNPDLVIQGTRTILHTETDDKTRCIFERLADNYKIKTKNYDAEKPDFNKINEKNITVTWPNDDNKTHSYKVQCQNKAEDYSSSRTIIFSVNFALAGTITSLSPSGVINYSTTILKVTTNKNAQCQYQEGATWIDFSTGAFEKLTHTTPQKTFSEGNYSFPIKCAILETLAERIAQLEFKVDKTPPRMDNIEDWNYTCNPLQIQPEFSATDAISEIQKYAYQLYDYSNSALLINWTETSSNNPTVSVNLKQGNSYYLIAKAQDQANYWSQELQSNGFTVKNASALECANDKTPPAVTIETTSHCKDIEIKILCQDASGCGQKLYDIVDLGELCDPSTTYDAPIKITQSKSFCYKVFDQIGNSKTGNQSFNITDSDGDGVFDNCDKCSDTEPGVLVTEDGCPPIESDCDCSYGIDLDLDGYGLNCQPIKDVENSACFDCDDAQRAINKNCGNGCIYDGDGDGYGFGCDAGPDCNDGDENVNAQTDCISGCIQDTDNDKYGIGCFNGPDCNDLDPTINKGCTNGCVQDADGDGYGLGCRAGSDCDDFNPSITNTECTTDCTNDLDCDGMPDDWETANGLNPNDPSDALLDPDKDNKNNLQEYRDGTDPHVSNLLIPEKPRNILKTILFILGLLFILGGSVYIVYKKYLSKYLVKKPTPPPKQIIRPIMPVYRPPAPKAPPKQSLAELAEKERREKAIELIKERIKEKKEKKEKFFEAFGKPEIKTKVPKQEIKSIAKEIKLPKKKHEFEKLKNFIETYAPGKQFTSLLKEPEKADEIFNKLDSIIKKKVKVKEKEKLTPEQQKKAKEIIYQVLEEKIKQQKLPEDIEKLRELSKKERKK